MCECEESASRRGRERESVRKDVGFEMVECYGANTDADAYIMRVERQKEREIEIEIEIEIERDREIVSERGCRV